MPALPALLLQLQATHPVSLSLCFVIYKMGRGTVPGGNGYLCLVDKVLPGARATAQYVVPVIAHTALNVIHQDTLRVSHTLFIASDAQWCL